MAEHLPDTSSIAEQNESPAIQKLYCYLNGAEERDEEVLQEVIKDRFKLMQSLRKLGERLNEIEEQFISCYQEGGFATRDLAIREFWKEAARRYCFELKEVEKRGYTVIEPPRQYYSYKKMARYWDELQEYAANKNIRIGSAYKADQIITQMLKERGDLRPSQQAAVNTQRQLTSNRQQARELKAYRDKNTQLKQEIAQLRAELERLRKQREASLCL